MTIEEIAATSEYTSATPKESTSPQFVEINSLPLPEAALRYAAAGWPVFPCGLDKRPLVAGGFKSATTDPEQIKKWWTKHPTASIGCPTGQAIGAWVLDVDVPKSADDKRNGPEALDKLEAERGNLPDTLKQQTGSGGTHVLFAMPPERPVSNSARAIGLDVRGDGGYIIVAPSGHESGGKYAWVTPTPSIAAAPDWLLERVAPLASKASLNTLRVQTSYEASSSAFGDKLLQAEVAKVISAPVGTRNDTLNKASFALGKLVPFGELSRDTIKSALLKAALAAGLPEDEAEKTIASGLAAGELEPATAPAGQSRITNEGLFTLRPDGVYYLEETKDGAFQPVWVCSHLKVIAYTRNEDGREWGRLLEVIDPEGRIHQWAMPSSIMAGHGEAYRSELLSLGLSIAPGNRGKQLLELYLSTARVTTFAKCVDRIGWHGNTFVMPDAHYGGAEGELIVPQGLPGINPFQVKGTLPEWKDGIGKFCVGNSRLVLAVCAALASPLLEPLGLESGGFHLVGGSSLGKTTALQVAGSVCGGGARGFIKTWRATDNGLEGTAAAHCDSLLCLDEMGQAGAKVVAEAAYMLGNGMGKARATKEGFSRRVNSWRLLFLSTGEITLADKISEDGRGKAKAGQSVRLVDVPADAGMGLGLFEAIPEGMTAEQFATHLKGESQKYYGSPLRAFLGILAADKEGTAKTALNIMQVFEKKCTPRGADGQVSRVCKRFALLAAAGELATLHGITPWKRGEAVKACEKCFHDWLAERGGIGPAEIRAGIEQVRMFIQAYGNSRLEDIRYGSHPVRDRVGYFRNIDGETQYCFYPEAFKKEVCAGYDNKAILKTLKGQGLIHAETGRHNLTVNTPEGKLKLHVVSAKILCEGSGDSEGVNAVEGLQHPQKAGDDNGDTHLLETASIPEREIDSVGIAQTYSDMASPCIPGFPQ